MHMYETKDRERACFFESLAASMIEFPPLDKLLLMLVPDSAASHHQAFVRIHDLLMRDFVIGSPCPKRALIIYLWSYGRVAYLVDVVYSRRTSLLLLDVELPRQDIPKGKVQGRPTSSNHFTD